GSEAGKAVDKPDEAGFAKVASAPATASAAVPAAGSSSVAAVSGASEGHAVAGKVSGDITARLIEKKVISEDQLQVALKEQMRFQGKKTIGAILVELGFISEGALGEILNESTGVKDFD